MNQSDASIRLTRRRLGVLAAVPLAFPARASGRHGAGDERFRPRIHYAPPSGFMDDPNGLIFHNGEYHLFYQFNPAKPKAANFHWGHAVSSDLLHWRTLPVVLEPTPQGMPFSGSAVFDEQNSSGLFAPGEAGLVAIYTRASAARQAQAIAFSTDGGRSFTDNPGNPVLDVGSDEFRDPKVMWHQPTGRWVMTVARPREHRVLFYGSDDLKRWEELGDFGGAGLLGTDYECPNLAEMPLEGGGSRWVLFVSTNPGAPLGGGAVQYFVGTFDGRRFVAEDAAMRLADFGQDFYSMQIYADVAGPPLAIAWMGNWLYCNDVPATSSRGAMTLPRRLSLRRRGDDWRLLQAPVSLDPIAGRTLLSQGRVSGTGLLAQAALPPGEAVEIIFRIEAERGATVTLSRTDQVAPDAVALTVHLAFNPNATPGWFMAITGIINNITMLAILLCGSAVIREREHGTMDHLLTLPLSPIEIASAKVLANGFVILVATALSLYFVVRGLLGVPIAGSIPLFMGGVALYLFSALAVGLFLATLVRSMPQFGLLFLLVFLPMQMLSGGNTPLESEPRILQVIMQGVASTHFVSFAEAILFRGAGLALVYRDYLAVAGLGAVFFALAVLRFRSSAGASGA